MSLTKVRDELVVALEETLQLAQRLAADARDAEVPVAELVAQASMLGRLDERREELIGELRRAASAGRRASRPGPPIRAVVISALDELGWPQNARFLEEYLWAKRELQLDSRAFASLRRDELRAWRRSPKTRSAYIVPALNPDGSPNPRWLTSSAWDLSRRVVASPESERLFDLQKIHALRAQGPRGPLGTLLERYVARILAIDPPPVSASLAAVNAWRGHVRAHTAALIEAIRTRDDPNRDRVATELAELAADELVWGKQCLPRSPPAALSLNPPVRPSRPVPSASAPAHPYGLSPRPRLRPPPPPTLTASAPAHAPRPCLRRPILGPKLYAWVTDLYLLVRSLIRRCVQLWP